MKTFLLLAVALFAIPCVRAQAPAGTHFIYLVRHGDYDLDSTADSLVANGLNALGREQAALTATRLAALPIKFDSIVTSQLTRARETGDIIAAKLGMKIQVRDAALNETRPPGENVDPSIVVPTAEAQLKQAWDRYAKATPKATTNDLIVCHGNVIRWFMCRALGIDTKQWSRLDIGNGSITVIEILSNGTTRLVTYNDNSHLPVGKQSFDPWVPDWSAPPASPAKK